jgi:hypothetical protein
MAVIDPPGWGESLAGVSGHGASQEFIVELRTSHNIKNNSILEDGWLISLFND